jgi:exodeoxyribonuclease V alpha subunit
MQQHWPTITALCAQEVLEKIDLLVAERLLAYSACQEEDVAAVIATLMALMRQGHLCLPLHDNVFLSSCGFPSELCELVQQGLKNLPAELVAETGSILFPNKPICLSKNSIYFQKNWVFETRFIHQLKRLAALPRSELSSNYQDPSLNGEQAQAITQSLSSPISLITGGPGTGKTYTAARVVKAYLESSSEKIPTILLAAPTGKAAARLGDSLIKLGIAAAVFKCSTLHALLGVRSSTDFMSEGKAIEADLLIVDECSMIDARLFSMLLSSVSKRTRLILMGDPDQLPPVEAGSLFADLSQSAPQLGIPLTYLTKCMRSERLEMLSFAKGLKEGKIDEAQISSHKIDLGLQSGQVDLFYEKLWDYAHPFFPLPSAPKPQLNTLLAQLDRFQILCPLRQGPYGTLAINQMLVERYRKQLSSAMHWWPIPILITRTDAQLGVFNGDTAILVRNLHTEEAIVYLQDGSSFPAHVLPSYEYAYCLSIHKSQGSEYERVLVLLPEGSERFGREVLYTAVTRARTHVCLDSAKDVLLATLQRSSRKISGFRERLSL